MGEWAVAVGREVPAGYHLSPATYPHCNEMEQRSSACFGRRWCNTGQKRMCWLLRGGEQIQQRLGSSGVPQHFCWRWGPAHYRSRTQSQPCGRLPFPVQDETLLFQKKRDKGVCFSRATQLPAVPQGMILLTESQPAYHSGGGNSISATATG